jgi:hypothetical protein
MSDVELTQLEVLRDLDQRRLTTEATARLVDGSEIVCGSAPRGFGQRDPQPPAGVLVPANLAARNWAASPSSGAL